MPIILILTISFTPHVPEFNKYGTNLSSLQAVTHIIFPTSEQQRHLYIHFIWIRMAFCKQIEACQEKQQHQMFHKVQSGDK